MDGSSLIMSWIWLKELKTNIRILDDLNFGKKKAYLKYHEKYASQIKQGKQFVEKVRKTYSLFTHFLIVPENEGS